MREQEMGAACYGLTGVLGLCTMSFLSGLSSLSLSVGNRDVGAIDTWRMVF